VIGSLRNSAKQSSSKMFWVTRRLGNLETLDCTASGVPVKMFR